MAYTPISTVRNLGIQSSAQKKLEDLRLQAQELAIKDRLDAKAATELDAALQDDLYGLRNATKDYAFTGADGSFNITSIKDKSLKYTPSKKNELLAKYRDRFTKLGVPFNINAFEESWQKGKIEENREILSDLNIAKSKGNISDDEFNQALDNEEFRRFYLNLSDANNQAMLTDLGYNPLYKTPEERWKAVKDRFSLGNIQKGAEEATLLAAENPLMTGPLMGATIYAGTKLAPRVRSMMEGTQRVTELSKAEQVLLEAEEAWADKGSKPTKIKRPVKGKFKTEAAFNKAFKRYEERKKAIKSFATKKQGLKTTLDEARDAVNKIKSGKVFKGKELLKQGVKGALPYMAPEFGGQIGEAIGGEEGELVGKTAGLSFLAFVKRKFPSIALQLGRKIAAGHTAGLIGGPITQGLALAADVGFSGKALYDLISDYREYLKTGKID